MFGHDDSSTLTQAVTNSSGNPVDQVPTTSQLDDIVSAPSDDQPLTTDHNWQHPGEPIEPSTPDPVPASDLPTVSANAPDSSNDANDLIDIKQQALSQLSPLVGHLDQSPEEKFRTTMMMIQASDDQSLIKTAYQAAQDISDDKTKAQALLDIVNEINYFTQHENKG